VKHPVLIKAFSVTLNRYDDFTTFCAPAVKGNIKNKADIIPEEIINVLKF
jgi:hypothetical protein